MWVRYEINIDIYIIILKMMQKKKYNNTLQMAYAKTFLIDSKPPKGYGIEVQGCNIHISIWGYEV